MIRITIVEVAIGRLRELGLTTTEAAVYIAVMKGEADAKKLSGLSGVPYSKIHTILSKLVRKSLIMEASGRPSTYSTKNPAEALIDYKRFLINDLEGKMRVAEEALGSVGAAADSEKPDIWIIKNQEGIVSRAYQTLSEAKREVKFALPVLPSWVLAALLPVLKRLKSDKINLKLLLPAAAGRGDLRRLAELGEVRVRDKMFGGGIISDENEALLLLSSDGAAPNLAIWSNHMGLIHVAKAYFDNLWGSSFNPKHGSPALPCNGDWPPSE